MSSNTYEIDRLKTLIEINTLINSSYSDVDALLIYILESAMRLVECESSSLLLADKTGGTLRFRVALGPAGAKIMNIPVDINNSIAGWVLKKGESLLINDVQNDVRFSPVVQDKSGYETKTMIAIPMRVGSTCIGVIELLNKKNGQNFTRSDLEILNLLSAQASVAYQNADQFRSAQNEISVLQNSITSGFNYHTFVVQSPVMLDLVNVLEEVAKTNSSARL